jgi:hypothetical protein
MRLFYHFSPIQSLVFVANQRKNFLEISSREKKEKKAIVSLLFFARSEIDAPALIERLVDDAPAEHATIKIKDSELPGRHCLIRRRVMQDDFIAFKREGARLIGLPITEFNPDLQGIFRLGADPIDVAHEARIRVEVLIFESMGHIENVLFDVFFANKPRLVAFAADPADAEPFALAEGVIEHPHVLAEDFAVVDIDDFAFGGREIIMKEFAKASFADEANAG